MGLSYEMLMDIRDINYQFQQQREEQERLYRIEEERGDQRYDDEEVE